MLLFVTKIDIEIVFLFCVRMENLCIVTYMDLHFKFKKTNHLRKTIILLLAKDNIGKIIYSSCGVP